MIFGASAAKPHMDGTSEIFWIYYYIRMYGRTSDHCLLCMR